MLSKLTHGIKQPKNLFFILLFLSVAVYGIVDNNLAIIAKVYFAMFLFGLLIGLFFYVKKIILK
jgi:hypothetical protein